jgi:hypothetical protein
MYSFITVGSENKTSSSILNNARVQRVNMNCSGVHYCEYLAPSLKAMHHYAVTPELLNNIRDARLANAADSRQKDANRYEHILNIL